MQKRLWTPLRAEVLVSSCLPRGWHWWILVLVLLLEQLYWLYLASRLNRCAYPATTRVPFLLLSFFHKIRSIRGFRPLRRTWPRKPSKDVSFAAISQSYFLEGVVFLLNYSVFPLFLRRTQVLNWYLGRMIGFSSISLEVFPCRQGDSSRLRYSNFSFFCASEKCASFLWKGNPVVLIWTFLPFQIACRR